MDITGLAYRLKNWKQSLSGLFGPENSIVLQPKLMAKLIKQKNQVHDLGLLSQKKVTRDGVVYLVADWVGGANDINLFKFHGVGTGTAAEANTDTALGAESTTVLNPDSTRATGTNTAVSGGVVNNVMQSVGTVSFDGSAAITEHGLFNQAATGGGTLWDRSVFSAINVVNGDSIQFTYQLTVAYEA